MNLKSSASTSSIVVSSLAAAAVSSAAVWMYRTRFLTARNTPKSIQAEKQDTPVSTSAERSIKVAERKESKLTEELPAPTEAGARRESSSTCASSIKDDTSIISEASSAFSNDRSFVTNRKRSHKRRAVIAASPLPKSGSSLAVQKKLSARIATPGKALTSDSRLRQQRTVTAKVTPKKIFANIPLDRENGNQRPTVRAAPSTTFRQPILSPLRETTNAKSVKSSAHKAKSSSTRKARAPKVRESLLPWNNKKTNGSSLMAAKGSHGFVRNTETTPSKPSRRSPKKLTPTRPSMFDKPVPMSAPPKFRVRESLLPSDIRRNLQ